MPPKVQMNETTYTLGPLILQVQSESPALQQRLATGWRQIFRLEPTMPPTAPSLSAASLAACHVRLSLTATPTAPPALVAVAPPSARFGAVAIWQTPQGFHFTLGRTWLTIGPAQVAGYLAADFWGYTLVEQRDFWHRLFFLLAWQAKGYLLHANALLPPAGYADVGCLFVGDCGSGKTTLSLSLIAAGWRYVGDDSLLLQSTTAGVMAHAVRRGFACTAETVARWPWLAPLWAEGLGLALHKRLVELEALYPMRAVAHCRPRLLFFPRIVHAPQSHMSALTNLQSFTTLLGQPRSGVLIDPNTTPMLLALYQTLITQGRSYGFDAGQDVFTTPGRVSDLLLQAVAAVAP